MTQYACKLCDPSGRGCTYDPARGQTAKPTDCPIHGTADWHLLAPEPMIITDPDTPPRPASIWIEIPIASIRNVSFEREVGPTITFNPRDPRNWEPGVISVPYETATKAMAMLNQIEELEP